MARVVIAPRAGDDLDRLITTHSLPRTTRQRVPRQLEPLARFPLIGASLEGRWSGYRFIVGPWRWLLIVRRYDAEADEVQVVSIEDGQSARAPTRRVTPSRSRPGRLSRLGDPSGCPT